MTTVFCRLTARPKSSVASAKQDVNFCSAFSTVVSEWAFRRLRLKRLPSSRVRMYIRSVSSLDSNAFLTMALKNIENSVGASTHPCFTPLCIANGPE